MPPFHDCRDGGLLVLDPAAAALFGGVRHRKRARVTAVHPRVFSAAEEALRAAPAAKRHRLREAPTPEVLRRVQGARAWGASSCVSHRWLELLDGIRGFEIKRAQALAVPDLNQVFVCEDEAGAEAASARPGRSERTLEGEAATDVALTATDGLRGSLESVVRRRRRLCSAACDIRNARASRPCTPASSPLRRRHSEQHRRPRSRG
ncbi:EIN3-binding F-box protein [Hordeum vulgare]|nr:EIN3-binding F-box protein [Hordeum vulgare]